MQNYHSHEKKACEFVKMWNSHVKKPITYECMEFICEILIFTCGKFHTQKLIICENVRFTCDTVFF